MNKSPLGQTGHKYALLNQLLPNFPRSIDVFYDPFVGSGNVAVNVEAEKIIINDSCTPIIEWLTELHQNPIEIILYKLDTEIDQFELSKENKQGYLELRDEYNKLPNPYWFYLLCSHSFSNAIRFNDDGDFNMPFGKRGFNNTKRKNMVGFVNEWQKRNVEFHSGDFEKLNYEGFVYFDPPYLSGSAPYNVFWDETDDLRLFNLLDKLDGDGVKWALSNVLTNNGFINHELSRWSQNYKTIEIDSSYRGSNYHRKNNGRTREVLIVNY